MNNSLWCVHNDFSKKKEFRKWHEAIFFLLSFSLMGIGAGLRGNVEYALLFLFYVLKSLLLGLLNWFNLFSKQFLINHNYFDILEIQNDKKKKRNSKQLTCFILTELLYLWTMMIDNVLSSSQPNHKTFKLLNLFIKEFWHYKLGTPFFILTIISKCTPSHTYTPENNYQ